MSEKLRWSKMKKNEEAATEVFLRKSEGYYVGACSRFIGRAASDKTWILSGRDSSIRAIILHSKRGILPVFCGQTEIPPPPFICGFFAAKNINSILGLKAEVLRLEGFMEGAGRKAYDKIDYDLMVLDQSPGEKSLSPSPAGLVLRKPLPADFDSLAGLQAAYEQEEVLPAGAVFSPAASRANLERLLEKAEILVAELDGRLVGKINVNAVSYTQVQIGGVYVRPDCRGQGIARRMTAFFADSLFRCAGIAAVSLFVKKANLAARALYDRLGFAPKADFRISYYK